MAVMAEFYGWECVALATDGLVNLVEFRDQDGEAIARLGVDAIKEAIRVLMDNGVEFDLQEILKGKVPA